MPVVPSTSISSPSAIEIVATPSAVTVGTPYSRPTIAACESMPPPSQAAPAILPKTGVQLGDVDSQTRIEPGSRRCISSEDCRTRAMPRAVPLAAGTPFITVCLAASGFCTALIDPGFSPKISMRIGSSTASGIVPSTFGISLRRACQWSKYWRRSPTRLFSSPW